MINTQLAGVDETHVFRVMYNEDLAPATSYADILPYFALRYEERGTCRRQSNVRL